MFMQAPAREFVNVTCGEENRAGKVFIESALDQKADHRSRDRIDKFNNGKPENLNLQTKHRSIEVELVD
jgi:hypothetical protein